MVTRGCTTLPGWVAAKRAHAVQVRASSGGVVPNGSGGLEPESDLARRRQFRCHAQRYRCDLRSEMAVALARLGIEAAPEAVSGIKTAMYRGGMGVFYFMKEQAELAQRAGGCLHKPCHAMRRNAASSSQN
jgi:hypothetical protein